MQIEGEVPYELTAIPSGSFTFGGTVSYEEILQYGTHGDSYVMEDKRIYEGYEFPPLSPWVNGKTERLRRESWGGACDEDETG